MADNTDSPSILSSLLMAAKKLPGQTVGGGVDLVNMILGGGANIVETIQGKTISRSVGEGLVPKPVGGSEHLNDIFGIPNKSSGLLEDSIGGVLNGLTPAGIVKGGVAVASKALIVSAGVKGATAAEIRAAQAADKLGTVAARAEFQNSGVYIGPVDGKPRAVIDDSKSVINPDVLIPLPPGGNVTELRPKTFNLDDVLGHPELYDLYPELKDVSVVSNPNLPIGNAGTYNSPAGARIEMGPQKSLEQFQTTLLHETQHVIQELEGFSRGASPRAFLPSPDFYKSFKNVQAAALELKLAISKKFGVGIDEVGSDLANLSPSIAADPDFQLYLRTRRAQVAAIETERNAVKQYKAVAGEAEARSVESAFTKSTGKALPPGSKSYGTDQFYPLDLYDASSFPLIPSPYDPKIKSKPPGTP